MKNCSNCENNIALIGKRVQCILGYFDNVANSYIGFGSCQWFSLWKEKNNENKNLFSHSS